VTDNIEYLPCVTKLDLPVERVIEGLRIANLSEIVICGYDMDGDLYFASSKADGGDILWVLEQCKNALMNV
jgi:hypothetical protein